MARHGLWASRILGSGLVAAGIIGSCTEPHSAKSPEAGASVPMARLAAGLLHTGIRTSMLAGDGLTVRDFIVNARSNHAELGITLYSHEGEEIYGDKAMPPPDPSLLSEFEQRALSATDAFTGDDGTLVSPIANTSECRKCHEEGDSRGVLVLSPEGSAQGDADAMALGLAEIIASAFDRIMTVGAQQHLGTYFEAIGEKVPGVENSAVFSMDGEPSIGDGFMEVPEAIVERALQPGGPFTQTDETGLYVATPLANKASCNNCHEKKQGDGMRGAIITHLNADDLEADESLRSLSVESVRHVMLTGLGRILRRFLTEVTAGSLTKGLKLYDREGRVFHDSERRVSAPAHIADILSGATVENPIRRGDQLVFAVPLKNEEKCQRCHAEDHPVRAVIELVVPTLTP